MPKAYSTLQFEDGKIKVDVYVIALEEIGASGVGNVSRVIEGIEGAVGSVNAKDFGVVWPSTNSRYAFYMNVSSYIHYDSGGGFSWTYLRTKFPVNATLHLVKDWATYREIVEDGTECVVVNIHGEIVPIPWSYSKEAWTDKIAEAMLYRNVTWVHVGGYPFYYAWYQGATSNETWGKLGFQQLMKHVGKGNVTIPCHPVYECERACLSTRMEIYFSSTWPSIYSAHAASFDYPLLDQDFRGLVALPIWNRSDYHVGAVVAFKNQLNSTSHGFYVHIGANRTFDCSGNPSDADRFQGFMGCATGLWSLVSRTARETLVGEAEALIQKAHEEGRTDGLQSARNFLENAKNLSNRYFDQAFCRDIYYAMLSAVKAKKPEPNLLQFLFAGLGLGISSAIGIGAVVWYKRKKNNNGEDQ